MNLKTIEYATYRIIIELTIKIFCQLTKVSFLATQHVYLHFIQCYPETLINMANIFSCCVPYCRSKSNETHLLSFHAFPEIGSGTVCVTDKFGAQILIDRREVWISTLKVKGLVTKSMRVCSLHFKESEFFTKGKLNDKLPKCN